MTSTSRDRAARARPAGDAGGARGGAGEGAGADAGADAGDAGRSRGRRRGDPRGGRGAAAHFGCANMRDQWVVYPGQLPGDGGGGGGGTGASSANAMDLTMHDARVQADALCAPMSMF